MRSECFRGIYDCRKDESKTRLTPAEWAEAEAKWTSGEYTLSKLEEEYGIRRETLSRHFKSVD